MAKSVLIVDDNEPTRALLSGIITGAGYQVLMAESGEKALTIARDNDVGCALIDQYMDPMDGFTLARTLQVNGSKFLMAMITANDSNDLLLQARKNGFYTILVKPVEPDRLLQLIARMCR